MADVVSRSHRSIGEVLSLLAEEHPDLTISKIRFLESQGLIAPHRSPSGYRKFYDDDINRLNWVLIQQRDNFLPLKEIKHRLALGAVARTAPKVLATKSAAELDNLSLFESFAGDESDPLDELDQSEHSEQLEHYEHSDVSAEPADAKVSDHRQGSGRFTSEQLAKEVGVDLEHIVELQRHGIITTAAESRGASSNEAVFSNDALLLAETAAALAEHGMPARNLRMFRVAADREAGVYEQLLGPLIARGDKERLLSELTEIIDLTERLRRLMLLQAIRSYL